MTRRRISLLQPQTKPQINPCRVAGALFSPYNGTVTDYGKEAAGAAVIMSDIENNVYDETEQEEQTEVSPSGFEALGLMPELQRAVEAMGFTEPTDIQAQAIPLLRSGADIIGRSQTGTGKTMAFAIPAVEMIDRSEDEPTVQVLILCPTRELAQQGCEEIKKLIRFMLDIWPVDVYGGAAMDRQIYRLKRANLVIGTPGRIMDHMRRGTLSLANVKLVVLDEADEMLSMGFREDIETILKDVPESRQTVLFSATMPEPILELTEQFMRDPQLIEINQAQVTLDAIHQKFMEVPMGRKLDALNLLLRAYEPVRTMLFCNTKLMVDEVSSYLNKNGFTCEGIHGDMNQSQRPRVMEGFKSARIPILVATDVAARGLDIDDIECVVNYDAPVDPETYTHRIGRAGRAGRTGVSITFVTSKEDRRIPSYEEFMGRKVERITVKQIPKIKIDNPELKALHADEVVKEQPAVSHRKKIDATIRKDVVIKTDMVVISIDIGKSADVNRTELVTFVSGVAGIPEDMIGRIGISSKASFVEVAADRADDVIRAVHSARYNGKRVKASYAPQKERCKDKLAKKA